MSGVAQFPPAHLIPEESREKEEEQIESSQSQTLSLPAPPPIEEQEQSASPQAKEEDDSIVKFDKLGPMVVNSDGTLSRIHNWQTMNDAERERTKRLVNKRNQIRLQALRESSGSDNIQEQAKG